MEKRIMIPQENITKEQEIKVINDFIKALPADSYLAAILEGFDAYCENEIENDFGINPLETINARQDNIEELQQEVDDWKKKFNDIEALAEAERDRREGRIIQLEQTVSNVQEVRQKEQQHAKTQYDELTEALKTSIAEKHEIHKQLVTAEAKLVELKAYAWDQYQEIAKLERQLARA